VKVPVPALVIGAVTTAVVAYRLPLWLDVAALVLLGGPILLNRLTRSSATVNRWGRRLRRKSGVASTLDVLRFGSSLSLRWRTARTVRPSLGPLRARGLARVPAREFAVELCRVGALRVWASVEDVILVCGGPRTGKSGWLAARIIDAPGAAVVTSTRIDLHGNTRELRSRRGPVYVFNAVGLGGLASTITFDPLTGCADPVTATERATDLLAGASTGGGGDREFWEQQARRVLAALLHAAALGHLSMRDVLRWVSAPTVAKAEVLSKLRQSPEPSFVPAAEQFMSTNDRTQTSITSTIMPALSWLTSSAASSAAAPSETPFDVAALLRDRGTVYLLGAEESWATPLLTALTGHIARQARRIAALEPSGRLDPPLTLALDEAALISPVPLASWTADMGGRGVTIIVAVQSRAQLIARWGAAASAVIVNNAGAVLLFGGTKDSADLDSWSKLAGQRDEASSLDDESGTAVRQVPVLSAAQLANLPARRVVLFRRGMPVAIGRARMVWSRWNRREIRQAVRQHAAQQAPATVGVVPAAELGQLGARPALRVVAPKEGTDDGAA
jgi:type IV secretion system protein VirD4